ncbi:DUF1684 domain-containing protein [Hymenobacter aquaticus]|uniref:DUF1684 domain-containing protein n=1 Tax=Hymenobacter aquaticus TaxID=1867101 RepID=A0A4Z0PTY6_9BACT|nr:DUF1684 domain-containing protein [Hymenobacter aquaticus]TGE20471.1 DUF1684 domain-containing protein [Hymenobacter aquaticus]
MAKKYGLTLMVMVVLTAAGFAQSPVRLTPAAHAEAVLAFQQELNAEYRDPARTPLPAEARGAFQGLPFFAADYRYYVEATFVRDSTSAPFKMKTTGLREPEYRKYGELHFTLNGKKLQLNVYQGLDLMRKPGYEDYLFVPFTDPTNGHDTYGGGRYLDFRIPKTRTVWLDFNRAYNPYCAYNTSGKYSCPVPPPENRLSVPVRAGVRADH